MGLSKTHNAFPSRLGLLCWGRKGPPREGPRSRSPVLETDDNRDAQDSRDTHTRSRPFVAGASPTQISQQFLLILSHNYFWSGTSDLHHPQQLSSSEDNTNTGDDDSWATRAESAQHMILSPPQTPEVPISQEETEDRRS